MIVPVVADHLVILGPNWYQNANESCFLRKEWILAFLLYILSLSVSKCNSNTIYAFFVSPTFLLSLLLSNFVLLYLVALECIKAVLWFYSKGKSKYAEWWIESVKSLYKNDLFQEVKLNLHRLKKLVVFFPKNYKGHYPNVLWKIDMDWVWLNTSSWALSWAFSIKGSWTIAYEFIRNDSNVSIKHLICCIEEPYQ